MTTQINNVKLSKTFKIYENLILLGFNASLVSMFSFNYNKDNRYLSIFVKDTNDRLNELFENAKNMEILLSKNGEGNCFFEVRKLNSYAEFINDEAWNNYNEN